MRVVVADRSGVVGGRAEPGDEQQVAPPGEQCGHRGAAVEPQIVAARVAAHFIHRLAPIRRCAKRTAVDEPAVEGDVERGGHGLARLLVALDPVNQHVHQFERRLGLAPHRHLPRVELGPLAAHRHQHRQREPAGFRQGQHVDAIADPARLHQQRGALTAKPGAGGEADPLLLAGQPNRADLRIGPAQFDQPRVPGIGDIADLTDPARFQGGEDRLAPIVDGRHRITFVHASLLGCAHR